MPAQVNLWSSRIAFYLGVVGAAVGLGSIWRFPYLAGTSGGPAFVVVFVVVCLVIATPLLVGEFVIGRWSRRNAPEAAGEVAVLSGLSRRWNAIGWLGTATAFFVLSYYTMIAGWVLAYTWKCASGQLSGLSHAAVREQLQSFLASPWTLELWQLAFVAVVAVISARGVNRGIEIANKIRAPALLILMLILVGYSLATGDVERGLRFAFAPDFSKLSPQVLLDAVGQAFYATGVGMAMMIAYGAYVPRGISLVRSALWITGSIVLVSVLATLMVFPLVFRYGMNPAQGSELVFEVLPTAFAEMPGGRIIGTLFFVLLAFAALTPSIAGLEPLVAWFEQRGRMKRTTAVYLTAAATWALGIGSVLSFSLWKSWHPLGFLHRFADSSFFSVVDSLSNIFLPVGALLTSVFLGWFVATRIPPEELEPMSPSTRRALLFSLRWICPAAILAVLVAALV
jgi:NSS family neurotransmitter:Na+ symporter